MAANGGDSADDGSLRFEDLTIDDDLPLLERVARYSRSAIALQRLVHVKMLSETAIASGPEATIAHIIPLLNPLVNDPETIIRQHLAIQLLPVSLTCMGVRALEDGLGHLPPANSALSTIEEEDVETFDGTYFKSGYDLVVNSILPHLTKLVLDVDQDARKAASDSIAGLATYMVPTDVVSLVLPVALRLAQEDGGTSKGSTGTFGQGEAEDLRITAATLLSELSQSLPPECITKYVIPNLSRLSQDVGFKVRKTVVQAIPCVVTYADISNVESQLLPMFVSLSHDDMYRVRKGCAEAMVDMSRGIIVAGGKTNPEKIATALRLRRTELVPVCKTLVADSNKFVRHGMVQFLGPFIASFFPLSANSYSLSGGVFPNYFPHSFRQMSNSEKLSGTQSPLSIALSSDQKMLEKVLHHRNICPPDEEDLHMVKKDLIPAFSSMATLQSGEPNIDAEMRVHCAYSLPAAVLLLGRIDWSILRPCFFALVNGAEKNSSDDANATEKSQSSNIPILAAKRCLASSLHALAYFLGASIVESELLPTFSHSFLRDSDEHTRLNTVKNLASFLAVLSQKARESFLPTLLEYRNYNSSQHHLNWRLRNIVAGQMCLFVHLFSAEIVRGYLLPLMYAFLKDPVAQVREETFICVPMILRAFCADKIKRDKKGRRYMNGKREVKIKDWAEDASNEVIQWLRNELGLNKNDFCMRQAFCRICGSIALAINEFDNEDQKENEGKEANIGKHISGDASVGGNSSYNDDGRYTNDGTDTSMTTADSIGQSTIATNQTGGNDSVFFTEKEKNYLHRILVYDLLSTALRMKDDHVTNVRLTLYKSLCVMPDDVRSLIMVDYAITQLAEEMNTWDTVDVEWNATLKKVSTVPKGKSTDAKVSATMNTKTASNDPGSSYVQSQVLGTVSVADRKRELEARNAGTPSKSSSTKSAPNGGKQFGREQAASMASI